MNKYASKIWKYFGRNVQWYFMWLVHSKFNVGISIIIPNSEGKILLGKHVFSGKEPWRLIGGYADKNENIYDAAKREAKEELGIDIELERVLRIRSGFAYRIEITLVAMPVPDLAMRLNKNELKEVAWFEQGKEPDATLDSHKYLIKLWKEKPTSHVEIENL